MVMFCVKTVQLDSHGDIRGRHLARLLETMLKTVREKGCESFAVDNLVALFVVARRLIFEINQSVSAVESGGRPAPHSPFYTVVLCHFHCVLLLCS